MADTLNELKRALMEALGGPVTEERSASTIKFVCTPERDGPSYEVYVEHMADGYQLAQSPGLPDRVNHAITVANRQVGAAITRPERDDTQPPLETAARPAEEAPGRTPSDRRPPGPPLAGIGGSWD